MLVIPNANSGELSSTIVTGLDMGGAGIQYEDVEDLNLLLGSGDDRFTVLGTHVGRTDILAADGEDQIGIRSINGVTEVNTGIGSGRSARWVALHPVKASPGWGRAY